MRSDSLRGWIIDAQLGTSGHHMDVWISGVNGNVERVCVPWCACIHVHAENQLLVNLSQWLKLPEISEKFSIGATRMVKSMSWPAAKSEKYRNTSRLVASITGILCSQ